MNPIILKRLAEIRTRDKALWRPGCLMLRDDIHFLLEHIDTILTFAASRNAPGGAIFDMEPNATSSKN